MLSFELGMRKARKLGGGEARKLGSRAARLQRARIKERGGVMSDLE